VDLGFVQYSSTVSTTPELRSTLFDFNVDALIHYRHNYYISISSDSEVVQFQLGNNAFDCARYTELYGYDSIGMMKDGPCPLILGRLNQEERKLLISSSVPPYLKSVKELVRWCRKMNVDEEYEKTRKYWLDFLKNARLIVTETRILTTCIKGLFWCLSLCPMNGRRIAGFSGNR